ncbi:MAG: DUF1631 family protein [Gammaproteobacteria bacterium]|nr:DUF1631 family protein [Gammaproteobacteria bacterium]
MRGYAVEAMRAVAEQVFESADDALYDIGERAVSDAERRHYFDTMRTLRLQRGEVEEGFVAALQAGFIAAAAPAENLPPESDQLWLQSAEEAESRVAIDNLVARADRAHRSLLWEAQRRLAQAIRRFGLRVSHRALLPQHLGGTLGAMTIGLPIEFEVKLILLKLLERRLIADLGNFYRGVLQIFQRHGIGATRSGVGVTPAVTTPPPAAPASAAAAPPFAPAAPEPAPAAEAAPATGPPPYPEAAESTPPPREARAALASRWFDAMTGAGVLSEKTRAELESLRLPLVAAAMGDETLLTNANHPLRKRLLETVELAITAHAGGNIDVARLQQQLAAWPQCSPTHVTVLRAALAAGANFDHQALGPAWLRRLDQIQTQADEQRGQILRFVRQLLNREMQLENLERQLPAPVLPLLRSGLVPLLAMRLLRDGHSSPAYRDGRALLDRVVNSLRRQHPPRGTERETLFASLSAALADINADSAKIDGLLRGLSAAYDTLADTAKADTPPPAQGGGEPPPPATATGPQPADASTTETPAAAAGSTGCDGLHSLLRVGAWYRVYDPHQRQTRWLKLEGCDQGHDVLVFSSLHSDAELRLKLTRFIEDLAAGLSELVNPSDTERDVLLKLRHRNTTPRPF